MESLKGCNTGLNVIPYNGLNYSGSPIHIVFWSGDKQCGIYRNMFNYTGKQCIGNNQFGNVIEYSQSDINCDRPIENTPIDTFTPLLAVAMVLVTFRKRLKWRI